MDVKYCWKCKDTKKVTDFYKNQAAPHGIDEMCIECNKAYARERYERNKEAERQRARTYYQKNKEAVQKRQRKTSKKYYKKWYANNPERYKARAYLNYYVKKGDVVKPNKCEDCGDNKPLQGHHEDYKKPLEVNWLCRQCHEKKHHD